MSGGHHRCERSRADASSAVSAPTVSLTRDMGTTQGADAPDNQTPPGVGGLTAVRAAAVQPGVA